MCYVAAAVFERFKASRAFHGSPIGEKLKLVRKIWFATSPKRRSIGVRFRLVWPEIDGTGLDGFGAIYNGPFLLPKGTPIFVHLTVESAINRQG